MKPEDFHTRDEHNAGAEIRLRDGAGDLTDCYLTVVGPDSDEFRRLNQGMQRDALLASFATDTDLRSTGARRASYLSQMILSNRGFEGEVDQERLETMFIMAPYLGDQVDKFIADRSNFTKPPATKS